MSKARFVQASIVVAGLLFSAPALAMQIQVFDRMAAQDQQDYIDLLMRGAEKVLIDAGRANDAAKVHRFFNDIKPGSLLSLGEAEFELNLDNARVVDAKDHVHNPNAPRLEVEDALAVTLKKNGIELPDSFFTVGSNFKPLPGRYLGTNPKPQQKK